MLRLLSLVFALASTTGYASRVTPNNTTTLQNKSSPLRIQSASPKHAANNSASVKHVAVASMRANVSASRKHVSNSTATMVHVHLHVANSTEIHRSDSASTSQERTLGNVRYFHHTAPEDLLSSEMQRAIRDSAALQSDLQTVGTVEKIVLQQADSGRIEKQNLEEQIAKTDKKLQAEVKIQNERFALSAEVKKLSLALQQQQQETAKQQRISSSLSSKVNMLENDMRVMSKAWKEAAQQQAAKVTALRAAIADATVVKAKEAPVQHVAKAKKVHVVKPKEIPVQHLVKAKKVHVVKAKKAHVVKARKEVTHDEDVDEDEEKMKDEEEEVAQEDSADDSSDEDGEEHFDSEADDDLQYESDENDDGTM